MGKNQPIGVRNNNPLNIRVSNNQWQGKVPSINAFEKFSSMEYGIRAGVKNLQTYYKRDSLTTISSIIAKWAPATENNVGNYINRVVAYTGIAPISKLGYDKYTFANLVYGMAIVELGAIYITKQQILDVIDKFKLF